MPYERLIGTGIMFFVFALLLAAGILCAAARRKKKLSVRVTADIVGQDERCNSTGSTYKTYAGIYRYAYEGKEYERVGLHSANPPYVGSKRELLINPEHPEEVYDIVQGNDTRKTLIKCIVAFCVIGSILLACGLHMAGAK